MPRVFETGDGASMIGNIGPLSGYKSTDGPVTAPLGVIGEWVYLSDAVTFAGTAYSAGTALRLSALGWVTDTALAGRVSRLISELRLSEDRVAQIAADVTGAGGL